MKTIKKIMKAALLALIVFTGCKKDDPSYMITFGSKSGSTEYLVEAKTRDGMEVKSGDRLPPDTEVTFTFSPIPEKPHKAEWYLDGTNKSVFTGSVYSHRMAADTKVELAVILTPKPKEPCISFVSAGQIGDKLHIEMWLTDAEKDIKNLWVDLNNNYVKDEGEDEFEEGALSTVVFKGVLKDRRVSVFGNVSMISVDNLESIDISGHPTLGWLMTSEGTMESLTIEDCPRLENIGIDKYSKLTKLELANLPVANILIFTDNKISSFKMTNVKGPLIGLDLRNNNLTDAAVTQLINELPIRTGDYDATLDLRGNPAVITEAQRAIAKAKKWKILPQANVKVPALK